VKAAVEKLREDEYVTNSRGIFEYVLGGSKDTKLLSVRVFDKKTKRVAYARQTKKAQAMGVSNCPICATGSDTNKTKIWKFEEMEADHVTAWSKGGDSSPENCQMLWVVHNRAKGNK
jgi:hypothetical protein